jgi:hypothetical protein
LSLPPYFCRDENAGRFKDYRTYLKSVKLGNLCAFLNESGHLELVTEQLVHNGAARLPLGDNCAQHRHTVHLGVLVKMTTTVEEVDNEEFILKGLDHQMD